ncbi:MAG: metallophosphoesterase family protein [Lachnospiraceae bacterium]|nr:metallophosphoesterase family protein [Lachnospiraceae bacterium]
MSQTGFSFDQDGKFKIMQLTDTHYTNDDENDHRTLRVMEECIEAESPDFIIVTGDLVWGKNNLNYLEKAVSPLTKSGIPWSFVFGNHDIEFGGTEEGFFGRLAKSPGFVGFHDERCEDRYGNHMFPVYGRNGELRWVIACINSGQYNPDKRVGGYSYVTRAQQDWYQERILAYEEENRDFSVLAFQHIPVPEIEEVWRFEHTYGNHIDEFCAPNVNSGQFLRMVEDGHTKGLFFGHDHCNSFYGKRFGVTLGYGRYTGFGCYGPEDFARGARVFALSETDTENFETWEILEGKRRFTPWHGVPNTVKRI